MRIGSEGDQPLGRVRELFRYPVKSMKGESLDRVQVTHTGFDGDRQYCFIQTDTKSGFPWLTARNLPQMVLYIPRYLDSSDRRSPVIVRTPEGLEYPVDSEELRAELEEKSRRRIRLFRLGRGAYDAMPVSLISSFSVDMISTAAGIGDLEIARFRPNIFFNFTDGNVVDSDGLVGNTLRFGHRSDSAEVSITLKDPRCKIVDVDPKTGQTSKAVMKALEAHFDNLLGVYGTVSKEGSIEKDDLIYLAK